MAIEQNNRHTGARKFPAKQGTDASDDFSQDAAKNKKPVGIGLSEALSDVDEKTRHSDGQNPTSAPSDGSTDDLAGHSKDPHTQDAARGHARKTDPH